MKNQPPPKCTSCGVTLTVKHQMSECRSNEEESEKHKFIIYQRQPIRKFRPDCQPENVTSFLRSIEMENS